MKVSKAATIWIDYHKAHSKKNTVRSYQPIIDRFCLEIGDYCDIAKPNMFQKTIGNLSGNQISTNYRLIEIGRNRFAAVSSPERLQ